MTNSLLRSAQVLLFDYRHVGKSRAGPAEPVTPNQVGARRSTKRTPQARGAARAAGAPPASAAAATRARGCERGAAQREPGRTYTWCTPCFPPQTAEMLAADALALLDDRWPSRRVHIYGASMGGFVAQRLALALAPAGRLASLYLAVTCRGFRWAPPLGSWAFRLLLPVVVKSPPAAMVGGARACGGCAAQRPGAPAFRAAPAAPAAALCARARFGLAQRHRSWRGLPEASPRRAPTFSAACKQTCTPSCSCQSTKLSNYLSRPQVDQVLRDAFSESYLDSVSPDPAAGGATQRQLWRRCWTDHYDELFTFR